MRYFQVEFSVKDTNQLFFDNSLSERDAQIVKNNYLEQWVRLLAKQIYHMDCVILPESRNSEKKPEELT